ncbi:DUF3311 domain-containing protein [Burkholderia sp. 9120]|uniref:DUF3311 domain-containing protein n=1 Tax=Burkholderia sp. 9120 TaxID=1500897 RepID=UPI0005538C38
MSWIGYIAVLPCVGIFVGIFFENKVRPFVFGMPFLFFWIVACVIAASLALFLINLLSPSEADAESGERS